MTEREWQSGLYRYRGTVTRVVDGDTITVRRDCGMDITHEVALRIAGVNAPESVGPTRAEGLVSKAWMERTLLGQRVYVRTYKDHRSFTRYVADVLFEPDQHGELRNLADDMIAAGVAVRTDQHGKAITP